MELNPFGAGETSEQRSFEGQQEPERFSMDTYMEDGAAMVGDSCKIGSSCSIPGGPFTPPGWEHNWSSTSLALLLTWMSNSLQGLPCFSQPLVLAEEVPGCRAALSAVFCLLFLSITTKERENLSIPIRSQEKLN